MKSALKLFVLLLVVLGTSCKKDNAEAKRRLASLTKAGWLTLKIEEKNTDGSWKDITPAYSALEADNQLIFRDNGYCEINEGELKFPGNAQIAFSGEWTFTDNASKIQIIGGNLMEILELNDTKLQVLITKYSPVQRYTFGHP